MTPTFRPSYLPDCPLVHHASLIDPSMHSPALLELVSVRLSAQFIDHIVDCVADAFDYAEGRPFVPVQQKPYRQAALMGFRLYVKNLLFRSEVSTPIILSSLVYIERSKSNLHLACEEMPLEQMLLGALVVASKYLNDHTMNNSVWEDYNYVFGAREISSFENQCLKSLNWNLNLTDNDIMVHYDGICIDANPTANVHPYFRCAAPRQRRQQSSRSISPDRCPGLDSPSSISTRDSSLPQTPSSARNTSTPSSSAKKTKSPFRRWLRSFHIHSRQTTTVATVA
ncbi:hypothetical protein J3R30DRAFT_3290870 [Lentinula aciculospora]|uniref:Cyclin N-terminal domain-containing protein n=1 Tax=Lentinula aciculospora TaxID=153920 RepID=A0A9W9A943_9AGAR|nr:hypothetical protein J3R30DRAFT_3290870 [Lentinula aciculospora]